MKCLGLNLRLQRALDLLLMLLLSPLWIPLVIVCSILVWLSDPRSAVFYTQKRVGFNGQEFRMYKFRTMVKNAEALKLQLRPYNERIWPDFKMKNDPRITKVGKLLRKSSLDELPQLLNVVKGEMSLVGPRPTSFSLSSYQIWHTERLEVRPGLTGHWQVRSRSTVFDERVRMDIQHVRDFSLKDSLVLILHTVPAAFKGQ